MLLHFMRKNLGKHNKSQVNLVSEFNRMREKFFPETRFQNYKSYSYIHFEIFA